MKILEKKESVESCAEAGWFAYDYFLDRETDKEFILGLKPLGDFTYLEMLKQPFFKIESDDYMIKGIQGNDHFRIAICGMRESLLEKLEQFIEGGYRQV